MVANRNVFFLIAVAVALGLAALNPACAQNLPTLKVETHLIDTTVSVHDAQGKVVSGLTQDAFSVIEDGVPQTIRFFTHDTQQPLSIGLVIDVSGSQESFVKKHEAAIAAFLRQILQPDDRAFAVCFGNHLRLVSDFSGSAPQILDGIHSFDQGKASFPEIGPKEDRELGTALNDAVYFSISEKLAAIHGRRKVLLVFSDGEENSSERDLLDAIEAAQDNDVLVYAIRYTDAKPGQMNARDRYGVRELDHLTAQTGGRSFDAGTTDLHADFAEIADDLRGLYALAYQSTNRVRDGAYRKVVIQTKQPGLAVRARTGYYAK